MAQARRVQGTRGSSNWLSESLNNRWLERSITYLGRCGKDTAGGLKIVTKRTRQERRWLISKDGVGGDVLMQLYGA